MCLRALFRRVGIASLTLMSCFGSPLSGQLWDVSGDVDPTSARYINNVPNRLQGNSQNTFPFGNFGGCVDYTNSSCGRLRPSVSLEALFLSRSDISGPTFVFDMSGPVLDYSDLTFDLETGFRVGYGVFTNDQSGFEFQFLRHENDFDQIVDGPSVTPVFFGGVPASPVSSYDVVYDVEMTSYEANYWIRANPSTRIGLGGRVFDFNETFDILFDGAAGDGFFGRTENQLYGLQVVADHRRSLGNGCAIVLAGKAGGFFNDLEVEGVTQTAVLNRGGDEFSFALDYRAGIELQLDFMTKLFIGYQGVYVTDLALAPTQSNNLSVFTPAAGSVSLEDINYNGLYAGGSITF